MTAAAPVLPSAAREGGGGAPLGFARRRRRRSPRLRTTTTAAALARGRTVGQNYLCCVLQKASGTLSQQLCRYAKEWTLEGDFCHANMRRCVVMSNGLTSHGRGGKELSLMKLLTTKRC
ncbi:uncharacterized protein [Triticum aestivum]|uniref:uncharacterized protein n=1 Tax=Triticum aestivum TaxID=4565 RepID=UPI001D0211D4|nr:uncharacterized protein LOC123130004 [Triticum aestivum]